MTVISYRSGVAIGELIVYVPALAIAVLLAIRHGFGRSSGWLYLILFSLVRIVGSCFQLAIINDPTNSSLYTGGAILQTIGLSPLELTSLGLLSRIISSINKSKWTFLQPYHMKLIQIIVMVGLILSIVGGIDSSDGLVKTGVYTPQLRSQIAMGLYIGGFALIVASTVILSFSLPHAEHGEKRLLLAVALSLPFILIRIVYSSISLFDNTKDFNSVAGSVTIFLCMALIMELCVVIIYEAVGLTLQKVQPAAGMETIATDGSYVNDPSKSGQVTNTLGPGYGVETQQPQGRRGWRRGGRGGRRGRSGY